MRIPRKIANFFNNLSLSDPKSWNPSLWNIFGSQSSAGENVNEYTALNYSAVWDAINIYVNTISTLPLHLMYGDGAKNVKASNHKLYNVMHSRFNPMMTAENGRGVMVAHLKSWGNAYAEKVYDDLGNIVELWPITPDRVNVVLESGEVVYKINVGSETKSFSRAKILHIPGLGFDGLIGYSPITMARKSIGLGMAMETYGSQFFSQGTHPGGIITHPTALKDPKAYREAFEEIYTGLSNVQRVMLLQEGMKFETIGLPPGDMQFLEGRQFQIPEIARWFQLPPHKLKDLTQASNNNVESEQISFVTDSILPVCIKLEQNFDLQLLTKQEALHKGLYFRHNLDGLLRGNQKERAEYYRIMFGIGAMSPNMIKEKEGFDPVDGGNEHFVPLNMIPLSRMGEYLDMMKKSPQAPSKKEDNNNVNQ